MRVPQQSELEIRSSAGDLIQTVSGPAGGFINTFRALAEGIRPSNGG